MASGFKTVKTVITRTNPETKQIEEVETVKILPVKITPDDEFYMVYVKFTAAYYDLKYADDIKILAKLCEWAEFEKGIVYLTAGRRKEIREVLGIHNSNISTSLGRLKDKNLISGNDGEFLINPSVYWKGSRTNRMELLKEKSIQVTFNFYLEDKNPKATSGLVPNQNFDK